MPAQRGFTEEDRLEQLSEFGDCCRKLAEILSRHPREAWRAGSYTALAEEAHHLFTTKTTSRDDLHRLSRALPEAPEWLNPKAIDSGLPTERWQKKMGRIHSRARELALSLRAVGTAEPT
ncbi:MAG: hypothetical protein M3323_04395 [Actinomycetota bacterium]|nr:hypothetical protein [Actinomycetota bacterium]